MPEALTLALSLVGLAATLAVAVARPPWLPEAVVAIVAAAGLVAVGAVNVAGTVDLLVLARDEDHAHRGPRSLGPTARYVVDHAPCAALLVWPDAPSG